MSNEVRIRVLSFNRESLTSAIVEVGSENSKKKAALTYDQRRGLYVGTVKDATGVVTVSAKGYEDESRRVSFTGGKRVALFVLGKRGMPFYHRRGVKTPFEPRPEVLALTLSSSRDQTGEDELKRVAKKLGLSREKVGEQVERNHVTLWRFDKEKSGKERTAALRTLLELDAVELGGPVVELHEDGLTYLTNQLVVRFASHVTRPEVERVARGLGLGVVRSVPAAGNGFLLAGPLRGDYGLLDAEAELAQLDDVVWVEPNSVTTSMLFAINPSDFLVGQQWHIPLINLPDAWQALRDSNALGVGPGDAGDRTFGSEDILIVVYDTGIESSTTGGVTTPLHPEFQGNVTGGGAKAQVLYDFNNMVANNDVLALGADHGMGCAGVAAATVGNPSTVAGEVEGVAGAAGNCPVMGICAPFGKPNLRWADSFVWMAGFNPQWVADGVNYPSTTTFPPLLANGVDIHTSSVRIPDVALMDDALDFMATYGRGGRGIVTFCAAGNTAANITNPSNNTIADHDKVITVAASINTDVRSGYSCFDSAIDICAPSNGDAAQTAAGAPGKVTTDTVGGGNLAGQTGGSLDYRNNFGGTSSATPLAAGVGALMLSTNPNLTWVQVREILRNTAVKIDAANTDPVGQWTLDALGNPVFSQWYGYGRVAADAAVIGARDFGIPSDVVIRDNLADDGSVPSGGWHANSPDIWTSPNDDPIPVLAYNASPPHANPIRGQPNYVYLRAKNVGSTATNEVYLRALITHFPGFEFRYPEEWLPSTPLGGPLPSPLTPGSYLIGEVMIDDLAAGADTIVKMTWDQALVPPSTVTVAGVPVQWHPCLLAEVSPHDGPGPSAVGSYDVKRYNDLAHKNITIDDPTFSGPSAFGVVAGTSSKAGVRSVVLDRRLLLPAARVFIRSEDPEVMATWIELAEAGRLTAPAGLPDWPERPNHSQPDPGSGTCSLTLVDRARVAIDCDGCRWIVDAQPGTRFWHSAGSSGAPSVSVGKVAGQRVIHLEGDGVAALELPLALGAGQYTALAIGVEMAGHQRFGTLRATQRLGNGELSAGYEIQG